MLDRFRRLAVAFAVTILLAPCTNLLAGTKSKTPSTTTDKSASGCPPATKTTLTITAEQRAAAADIFETRCVACHGDQGHGDGPAAANLNPGPRDFHSAKWQRSVSDATLTKAIIYGGESIGVSAEMAANPDLESEPSVVAVLVERVRSFCQ
jgi:cytochrome c553